MQPQLQYCASGWNSKITEEHTDYVTKTDCVKNNLELVKLAKL